MLSRSYVFQLARTSITAAFTQDLGYRVTLNLEAVGIYIIYLLTICLSRVS